ALDLIRGIESIADIFLNDQDSESEGKYSDADEGEYEQQSSHTQELDEPSNPGVQSKNKYRRYRNRCMSAESLDLSDGLPEEFEQNWIMVGPIPKGKRCLALSFGVQNRRKMDAPNTILLSRKSASLIGSFTTGLPSDCILDCVYDSESQVLWVLDLLKWKDQAMIDCEANFRFWWRDSKISELGPQNMPTSANLLIMLIPVLPGFSNATVATVTCHMMAHPSATQMFPVLSGTSDGSSMLHTIKFQHDGLLFYLQSATYESGETTLAGWVPLQVPAAEATTSGIGRLNLLCQGDNNKMQE
ncbi:hypothetical protein O181_006231, partial [Austropuccinia psidii MF-1]|nr:hypothetical protein [Austropuccinia psidii MF-1]